MYHRLQLTTRSYLQVNFTKISYIGTLTEILLKVALDIIKQTNKFISVYIRFALKKTHVLVLLCKVKLTDNYQYQSQFVENDNMTRRDHRKIV
jgi:hypothetical protein